MLRSFSQRLKFALRLCLLLTAAVVASAGLHAQNYSWDARSVGMGGATGLGDGNLATSLVPAERSYTSIVVPLGFTQLFSHLDAALNSVQGYALMSLRRGFCQAYSGCCVRKVAALKSVSQGFPQCAQNDPFKARLLSVTFPS